MVPRALITGITGQDGSYLAELLLTKGYQVHGIVRRSSSLNTGRIDHIFDRLSLHFGDVTDGGGLSKIVAKVQPDEVYHLAAQSHVRVSFDCPDYSCEADALGTLRVFEAVRDHCPSARVYNAASSEMFGSSRAPQNEDTPFHPRSPYGCAKVFGFELARNYRESYGMHVSSGILFNHESPRRGLTFVTRKIARAAARISAGKQAVVSLGNLDAQRDWGYAPDYVDAMWRMLQQDHAGDFVVATGEMHTVSEFADLAFQSVGLDWREFARRDDRYLRPAEVDELCGDASRARSALGWEPTVRFRRLVGLMVEAEVDLCSSTNL